MEQEYKTGDTVKTIDGKKHFISICYPNNDKMIKNIIMDIPGILIEPYYNEFFFIFFDDYPIVKSDDILPTRMVLTEKTELE